LKTNSKNWKATALLYAGKPDPEWMLSGEQQEAWMKLWKQAPLLNRKLIIPSVLGYKGCRLQHNEHSHWQLYNGCVSYADKEVILNKKDQDRQMEFFLLSTAPEEVTEMLHRLKIL
jgi:hypothetical protein